MHFDIIIDGSPTKCMVFTIQCNNYGQTNWKNLLAYFKFSFLLKKYLVIFMLVCEYKFSLVFTFVVLFLTDSKFCIS